MNDDPQTLRNVRNVRARGLHGDGGQEPGRVFILTEKNRSALVLLDLTLPREDGIELMKHALAPVDMPGTFISGYGRDEFPCSSALPRQS